MAVVYVGDLVRMRAFYERCFCLTELDFGPGFVGLRSDAWLLTLVESPEAKPRTSPPAPRVNTPIKLAFEVAGIDELRPLVAELGGEVHPADSEWVFRGAKHCDCLDPEGNIIQLIET